MANKKVQLVNQHQDNIYPYSHAKVVIIDGTKTLDQEIKKHFVNTKDELRTIDASLYQNGDIVYCAENALFYRFRLDEGGETFSWIPLLPDLTIHSGAESITIKPNTTTNTYDVNLKTINQESVIGQGNISVIDGELSNI